MAEAIKTNRVKFPKGEQKKFIELALHKLGTKIEGLAKLVKIHPRSCRDWRREKFTLPLSALESICAQAKIKKPLNIEIKNRFWYASIGAKVGGKALIEKYGRVPVDENYRKKKWLEWWRKEGRIKYPKFFQTLSFVKPAPSEELAEFMGIMMGDGGISKRQICVTLHHIDDLQYSRFVANLMEKLFKVRPAVYHSLKNSVNNLVISRTKLVEYLHNLGLPIGNKVKQRFDIPKWIKSNPKYKIACLRGLVDTDGSVFNHKYKVNGKWYAYTKLAFCTASALLRNSVFKILTELKLNPRMAQLKDVRLDSKESLKRYFQIVGSHNPKHINRYKY